MRKSGPFTVHEIKPYTAAEVIKWLSLLPPEAHVWGYEGEINGIVAYYSVDGKEVEAYIQTEQG